jgi:RP/EB family microtubule-associated protein
MGKVNWMAKAEHEFIPNYKILQAAFDKNSIEKHIDVDKLIRAKYQDNLEFLQWMKAFWERESAGRCEYDSVKAREGRPLPPWAKALGVPTQSGPTRPGPTEKENLPSNRETGMQPGQKFTPATRPSARTAETSSMKAAAKARPASAQKAVVSMDEELKVKVADQAKELEELRSTLEGLEQERDYYFGKLRSVEILCTTLEAKMDDTIDAARIIKDVQSILYAENDDDEREEIENSAHDDEVALPRDYASN